MDIFFTHFDNRNSHLRKIHIFFFLHFPMFFPSVVEYLGKHIYDVRESQALIIVIS